jgi:hypothetical protein
MTTGKVYQRRSTVTGDANSVSDTPRLFMGPTSFRIVTCCLCTEDVDNKRSCECVSQHTLQYQLSVENNAAILSRVRLPVFDVVKTQHGEH